MTPEELQAEMDRAALARGAWVAPAKPSDAVQHVASAVAVLPEHVRQIAEANKLVGEAGELYCWNCQQPCEWHASLHCAPCRVESRRSEPERRRREREARRAQQERERERREQEPSSPVAARAFR